MKQTLLSIVLCVVSIGSASSETLTHTFTFSETDFSIIPSSTSDSLIIASLTAPSIAPDLTEPRIPILAKSIAIPRGCVISDYTVSVSKRLIRKNVNLIKSMPPQPSFMPSPLATNPSYFPKIYPDSNCVISSTTPMGEAKIVDFLLVPYVFDAVNHELHFVDSISVQLNLVNYSDELTPTHLTPQQYEQIMSTVENPEITATYRVWDSNIAEEEYEYLIITNQALKSTFRPLAEWKYRKGIRSKIITTEEIDDEYDDATQQMRIKKCIQNAWEKHGTRYVLLGGDTNIIPTQYCYMRNSFNPSFDKYSDNECNIPTDIYYACLDQINWDTNNDGYAGDFWNDKININPCVDISRLPVQTEIDCQTAVNRIIEYEKNPRINMCFFQAGTMLTNNFPGELVGDAFYDRVINQKIFIDRDKIFANIELNYQPSFKTNFAQKLAQGASFAQLICHGNEDSWSDTKYSFYTSQNATTFENPNHTFISTIACHTNAFDYSKTCLSEAFLRNSNSGVIGYLGSSRFGWLSTIPEPLSNSMAYETDFYERLFNLTTQQPFFNKSFGTLVSTVKRTFRNLAEADFYYRWLHYSINAIGDPETPIFTKNPFEFTTSTAETNTFGTLTVNTGVDEARICVSSLLYSDNPNINSYYSVDYGKEVTFENVPEFCEVWITKQNYIPKHFSFGKLEEPFPPIENDSITDVKPTTELIFAVLNSATSQLTVRFSRSLPNSTIKVGITPISGGNAYLFPITNAILVEENVYETDIDLSGVSNGTYAVNLYENNAMAKNSFKILKK